MLTMTPRHGYPAVEFNLADATLICLLGNFRLLRQRAVVARFFQRWGTAALILTRPMPLGAETFTVLAGASPLGWWRATAALLGTLPVAVICAMASASVSGDRTNELVLIAVATVASITWLVGQFAGRRIGSAREILRPGPSAGIVR